MQVGLVGNRAVWYIIKMGSAWEQQGWKGFLYGKENSHGEKVNARISAIIAVEVIALSSSTVKILAMHKSTGSSS